MKLSKKLVVGVLTVIAAAGLITFNFKGQTNKVSASVRTELSGKQIFNGFFLDEGPAAQARPSSLQEVTHKNAKISKAQYQQITHKLDAYVAKKAPTFFSRFQKDVYSKNYAATKHDITVASGYFAAKKKAQTSTYNTSDTRLTESQEKQMVVKNSKPMDMGWWKTQAYVITSVTVAAEAGVAVVEWAAAVTDAIYFTAHSPLQSNVVIHKYVDNINKLSAAK